MPRFNNFVGLGSLRTATPQRPDGEPVQTSRIRHNLRAASNLARFRTAGERIVASRGLEQRLEPMRAVWKRLQPGLESLLGECPDAIGRPGFQLVDKSDRKGTSLNSSH